MGFLLNSVVYVSSIKIGYIFYLFSNTSSGLYFNPQSCSFHWFFYRVTLNLKKCFFVQRYLEFIFGILKWPSTLEGLVKMYIPLGKTKERPAEKMQWGCNWCYHALTSLFLTSISNCCHSTRYILDPLSLCSVVMLLCSSQFFKFLIAEIQKLS